MSLDVTLKDPDKIYGGDFYLYDANITHNLNKMADKANIYEALWRPHRLKDGYNISEGDYNSEYEFEDNNPSKAKEIIPIVEEGLNKLKSDPEYFKQFDSPNGWGTYVHFVPFVEGYLNALKNYPESIIEISR